MSLVIEGMQLGQMADLAARLLVREFGYHTIEFTRGYSDLRGQVKAMSKNVAMNRGWIRETYRDTPISQGLQDAVDRNPHLVAPAEIEECLYRAMLTLPNYWELSLHMKLDPQGKPAAEAFDLVPIEGPAGEQVQAFIHTLPNMDVFLTKEGGLDIWHVQFRPRPTKDV